MKTPGRFGLVLALAFTPSLVGLAQDAGSDYWKSQTGKRPPLVVATAASGKLAVETPFNPSKFGLVRGFSPGTDATGPCVIVYTTGLNDGVTRLTTRLDALVAAQPDLGDSVVHVFDAKGAQRGGYTAEELMARIGEIARIASANQWTHLSVAIAASPGVASHLGLDASHDVVIVALAGDKNPTVAWSRVVNAKDLDAPAIAEIEASIRKATSKP